MHLSQLQYLPLSPSFYSILVGIFVVLLVLLKLGILRYAYVRMGLSSTAALLLLLASLVGSYFNIEVARLPPEQVVSGAEVQFFGMRYVVPVVVDWPGTVIALNVGGGLIPTAVSLYLIIKHAIWLQALVAIAWVALICHLLAQPVAGLGIALPVFVPSLAAAAGALVFRRHAAPLAYAAGSIGTLIGADLLNLGNIGGLGAPVASIGGAGTFDGIFLVGIAAVLIAGIFPEPRQPAHSDGT